MPYKCKKVNDKYVVHKKGEDGKWSVLKSSGKHDTVEACQKQVKALYAQEGKMQNEVDIELDGYVGYQITADGLNYDLSYINKKEVRISISSKGGDYLEAITIFNKFRECGKKVTTVANGPCISAGAVVLLGGDTIEAASNAIIMFHKPTYSSDKAVDEEEVDKIKDSLTAATISLINTIKERTGWDDDKIRSFLTEEKWLTAQEALDMGIIDKILPFKRKRIDKEGLNAPSEILNFVDDQNKELDMTAFRELCSSLEIEISNEATEEEVTQSIVNCVSDLRDQLKQLNEKIKEAEQKIPKPKSKLPTTLLNMVRRNREGEVNQLVSEGKITVAVANELKTVFITDDIQNHVDEDGNISDAFDKTMDALRKNEKVLNLGERSGTQQLPKTDPKENPLLLDAESRAKKGR
jgi:ATP-dependent protease ClpP protease subunit